MADQKNSQLRSLALQKTCTRGETGNKNVKEDKIKKKTEKSIIIIFILTIMSLIIRLNQAKMRLI